MTSDVDNALSYLNEITGKINLSEHYKSKLAKHNLTENDGYLIKLKLNDEILHEKLDIEKINERISVLINNSEKQKPWINENYNMDLILYLHNQDKSKSQCNNCGASVLAIDEYCSKCGHKIVPKLSVNNLLSTLNSGEFKPGDILKVNTDNRIEKVTFTDTNPQTTSQDLRLMYENKLNKNKLNFKFFKILLLHAIRNNNYTIYNKTTAYNVNLKEVIQDLIDENFIKSSENNMDSDIMDMPVEITSEGDKLLNMNRNVILYDIFIKDSRVDDILVFNNILENNHELKKDDMIDSYLETMRDNYLKDVKFDEYLATFDVESYYYELEGNINRWIRALLKKFIALVNMGYLSSTSNIIRSEVINYIQNVLTKESVTIEHLDELFNEANESFNADYIIISPEISYKYLLRSFNEDLCIINSELHQRYNAMQ